jgi:hypothetical protein
MEGSPVQAGSYGDFDGDAHIGTAESLYTALIVNTQSIIAAATPIRASL